MKSLIEILKPTRGVIKHVLFDEVNYYKEYNNGLTSNIEEAHVYPLYEVKSILVAYPHILTFIPLP